MSPPPDLVEALRALPLFPLRGVVLFPGDLLPLHVFEPRYRALVRDVLAGHRSLAVVHVSDPGADLARRPPIAEVAGIGTIMQHVELPGGRYNILVRGRARVRLQELCFQPPYRRAIATMLDTEPVTVPDVELAALHAAASAFIALVRRHDEAFMPRLPRGDDPGLLIDAVASLLLLDVRDRQSALEALDLRARARLVTEALTSQRAALDQDGRPLN